MGKLLLYHYIIALSLLVGTIRYRRLYPEYIRLFIPFLLLTFMAEVVPVLKDVRINGSNHWWFNIFTVIEFVFFAYIFSWIIENRKVSKVILLSAPIYFLLALVNILLIQGGNKFHTISYRIGSVMIIVYCYLYFRQLLNTEYQVALLRNSVFWIVTGILFFYLGFFFYMNAFDYIVYKKLDYSVQLWRIISRSLNILLYTCFLIALLCSNKEKH